MKHALLPSLALGASLLVVTQPARGQEQDWEPAGPGEHHAAIGRLAGKWKLAVTLGGDRGTGETEFRPVMGGRFLLEETRVRIGDFAFGWMGLHGYDDRKALHVSTWIDTLENGIEPMEGRCTDGGTTIAYATTNPDHRTGGTKNVEWVLKAAEQDRFTVEMRTTPATGAPTVDIAVEGTRSE